MELSEKSFEVTYIPEPNLAFGYGQISDHPKDGLFLYGPLSASSRSKEVSIGVIGTKEGLSYFRNWAIRLGGFIEVPPPGKTDKKNRLQASKSASVKTGTHVAAYSRNHARAGAICKQGRLSDKAVTGTGHSFLEPRYRALLQDTA